MPKKKERLAALFFAQKHASGYGHVGGLTATGTLTKNDPDETVTVADDDTTVPSWRATPRLVPAVDWTTGTVAWTTGSLELTV
jgi:hypothetical protein